MELLIDFVLVIVVGAFLQHGFSAIAGRESIIDKITGGKKEDGVTGRIAPPANRVPPKTESPKGQESSDNSMK